MRRASVKKKKRPYSRQQAFNRFMLIVAALVIWIGGIGARLVYLQVHQHEWLSDQAAARRKNVKSGKMPRGTIYDRDGRVLALSVTVKTLYADATEIDDVAGTAKRVAKATGTAQKEIARLLAAGKETGRKFVPLARGLSAEDAEKINKELDTDSAKKSGLPRHVGLYWRDQQSRSYPHETLAAHVIGFANADGVGQAGIEQSQNELLYGAVIKKIQERDRLGRVYDEQVSEKEPPKDVVLTIRNSIQHKTESPLAKAVENSGAKAGMAVVIDHRTGEILAMANYPTFDPNKLQSISADNLMNRSVQSVYSPGSVFKLITYGAALDRKLFSPDGMLDKGNGTIEVGGRVFKDHGSGGQVTYAKALAQSSNVGAIRTAMRVGKNDFHASIRKFGFGTATGVELPAETSGIVRDPARWNGDSLASMAIGYEIGVSALQMATAFATIANDGVRVRPHIIKEIRQFDEKIGNTPEPAKEQVVSAETARGLRTMLRDVVLSGTGKRAAVDGYSVAGKTGTAWKFDEKLKRVNSAKYMSSFIGFAPANDPQVTIAVIIDEPKIGGRDGGQVAAPVFREIAEQILPELNIQPDLREQPLLAEGEEYSEEPIGDMFGSPLLNAPADVAETEPAASARSAEEKPASVVRPPATVVKKSVAAAPEEKIVVGQRRSVVSAGAKPLKKEPAEPKSEPRVSERPRIVKPNKAATAEAKRKT